MAQWWAILKATVRRVRSRRTFIEKAAELAPLVGLAVFVGAFATITIQSIIRHSVAGSILGLLVTPLLVAFAASFLRQAAEDRTPTLQSRLGEVRGSLEGIGRVLGELDLELDTRMRALEESQARLEQYEQMASVTPEQRAAIDQFFDQRFEREGRRSGRRDLLLFLLGLPFGFAINLASPPLWHWLTK